MSARAHERFDVAVVGSGFAGALAARVLATLGRRVALLERGTHPRFAIGESSTPLANLSLERIGRRYGFADCYRLATHGRWLAHHPDVRRGLKRGFTFYRHHPGQTLDPAERLLVAASPSDDIADTHWLRADVDHHFVREAVRAGVDYRDRATLTHAEEVSDGMRLTGTRDGEPLAIDADFVIDASGPNGFLARQLGIPSALDRVQTHSALVFGHFADVRLVPDVVPGLCDGPYPDDRAAVHHVVDEGWMYALRFDHDVTSAGFLLRPDAAPSSSPAEVWRTLVHRYPTIAAAYGDATPVMPIGFVPRVQHRLAHATGARWAMLPHAFAFVDPLFSTGIAWGLRAVERLAPLLAHGVPDAADLARYDGALQAEATQIDLMVAGAYEAMRHFDLLAAHAMVYFAIVSFAEVRQRLVDAADAAWGGFLGVGDPAAEPLPGEALRRLRALPPDDAHARRAFVAWVAEAIAPRNVAGLADPARGNLYPVDLDVLVDRHALLGMRRDQLVDALPALRGMSPDPF
ncbi:MAG: tryptophan 7-halogenase [Gemmatirosa sp.]|nr:tryptophan 7-halogenase [Gemmatirosa sp.]